MLHAYYCKDISMVWGNYFSTPAGDVITATNLEKDFINKIGYEYVGEVVAVYHGNISTSCTCLLFCGKKHFFPQIMNDIAIQKMNGFV